MSINIHLGPHDQVCNRILISQVVQLRVNMWSYSFSQAYVVIEQISS